MSDSAPPPVPHPESPLTTPAYAPQPQLAAPAYPQARPPEASPEGWAPAPSPRRPLQSIGAATRWLILMTAVLSALLIVIKVWGLFDVVAYSNGAVGFDVLQLNSTMSVIINIPLLVASAGAGICWLVWQYRAAASLPGQTLRRSPGWHVGAWFVPIISLWWPFQNTSDLARGSRAALTDGTLGAWWALWIISSFVSRIGLLFLISAPTISSLFDRVLVDVLSDVLRVAAAPFALAVVARITEAIDPRALTPAS